MYSSYHLCPLKKKKKDCTYDDHMQKVNPNPMVYTSCNQFYFSVIMEDSHKDALTESICYSTMYATSYLLVKRSL